MDELRELDARLATFMGLEVVGWAVWSNYDCCPMVHAGEPDEWSLYGPVYVDCCVCDLREDDDPVVHGHTTYCLEVVPLYSTDLNVMARVEAEIKRRGLMYDYGLELMCEVDVRTTFTDGENTYNIATATAEQRARAAAKVIDGIED